LTDGCVLYFVDIGLSCKMLS